MKASTLLRWMMAIGLTVAATGCATEVEEEEDVDSIESSVKAAVCTDFDVDGKGGCARPPITITKVFEPLNDRNGAQKRKLTTGRWYVSSCTTAECVIYREGGDLFTVSRTTLVKYTATKTAGVSRTKALEDRTMERRSAKPAGKALIAKPQNLPEPDEGGWAPQDGDGVGSNESVAGRGGPLVMWGVETPTGKPSSRTGYAGIVVRDGAPLVDAGKRASGAAWVDAKGKVAADAKWALVWAQDGKGEWVKQWVLMQVTSRTDPKKKFVLVQGE